MLRDDPILGRFFDTPDKLARWHRWITLAYIIWILFVIIGILVFFFFYLERIW